MTFDYPYFLQNLNETDDFYYINHSEKSNILPQECQLLPQVSDY